MEYGHHISLDFGDNQELWNIPSTLHEGVDTRQSRIRRPETELPAAEAKLNCTVQYVT